jgi:hypothetical protein
MKALLLSIIIILMTTSFGNLPQVTENSHSNTLRCNPFFEYDKIEYYKINIEEDSVSSLATA